MKKVLGCLLFAMLFFSVGYSQNNTRLNDGYADIEGIVSFMLKSEKYHSFVSYGIGKGVMIGDSWDAFLKAGKVENLCMTIRRVTSINMKTLAERICEGFMWCHRESN